MSNKNPWGAAEEQNEITQEGNNWLSESTDETSNSLAAPFETPWFPMEEWVEGFVAWLVTHFRDFFIAVKQPIDGLLTSLEFLLSSAHPFVIMAIFGLTAWQMASFRLGLAAMASLLFIGAMGAWHEAMITLSLVMTAVIFSSLIGIPLGIWGALSPRANQIMRPILDAMQTTPAFVYLVPIVMLFGIGNVPGIIVTIIFALPPVIRLTTLGIRQVPDDLIEASHAFGASRTQLLFRVQIPMAMPTIMAGVNQTLMLSLSMVVIASMIAVGGLGLMVMRGIGRLDIGLATVGGVGIVLLAILLDRMTQAVGRDARERECRHWYQAGPIGLILTLFPKK